MKVRFDDWVDLDMEEVFISTRPSEKIELYGMLKKHFDDVDKKASIRESEFDKAIKKISESYHRLDSDDENIIKLIAKRL